MAGKKVLFIRYSSLGDVVLANYDAMMIKQTHPEWKLTWFVNTMYSEIIRTQPWVDDVVEWNSKRDGNMGFLRAAVEIHRRHFDIIADDHWPSDRSSLLSFLSRAPKRYANHRKWLFAHTDYSLDEIRGGPDTRYNCPKFLYASCAPCTEVDKLHVRNGSKTLALSIGASFPKKRWPVKCWVEFCKLASDKGFTMCLLGAGHDEKENAKMIISTVGGKNVIDFVDKLTLTKLLQVIDACDLAVTGDTGSLHIARALGKPVVALLGPTYWRDNMKYMQSMTKLFVTQCPLKGCENWACEKPCLETIKACDVLESINGILTGCQI